MSSTLRIGGHRPLASSRTSGEPWLRLGSRHDPWQHYRQDDELRRALDMIRDGGFSRGDRTLFAPVIHSLLAGGDRYVLLADYASYVECQGRVARAYLDPAAWTRKSHPEHRQHGALLQ